MDVIPVPVVNNKTECPYCRTEGRETVLSVPIGFKRKDRVECSVCSNIVDLEWKPPRWRWWHTVIAVFFAACVIFYFASDASGHDSEECWPLADSVTESHNRVLDLIESYEDLLKSPEAEHHPSMVLSAANTLIDAMDAQLEEWVSLGVCTGVIVKLDEGQRNQNDM